MRFALGIVEKWCKKVKLSVNPSKPEAVLFTSRYKVDSSPKLAMYVREIRNVKEAKYQGIMLEKSLGNGMRESHASLLGL